MVVFLHEHGVVIDKPNKKGRTPLMEAAPWGHSTIVDFLLEDGANPAAKNRKGRTPLDFAKPSKGNTKSGEGEQVSVMSRRLLGKIFTAGS